MKCWSLQLRGAVDDLVDASPIRMEEFALLSRAAIERVRLPIGARLVALAEVFTVAPLPGDGPRLVLEGDLSNFRCLGDRHRRGEFRIEGHAGDHLGCSMSGGRLRVSGDAGDFLAAPTGARRSGMSGGRIEIGGQTGHYAGHRMRRGEIFIEGDTGDFAASHQVAGTMVVAGSLGAEAGYGMRRGSLIATRLPRLTLGRFSQPIQMTSVFPSLIRLGDPRGKHVARLIESLASGEFWACRGDRAVGGQGEILAPHG